ncbi:MAG: GGDEF domain-containing protein, partial [Pseudomonadota bacterium]
MSATSIDPLCFTMTLACAMYTMIAFVSWRKYIREAYTLCWTIAFVAATLRWGVECLGPELLGKLPYDFMVEAMAIALIVFASFGHCLRVGDRSTLISLVFVASIGAMVLITSTIISPHDGLREASAPGVAGVAAFFLAAMILRNRVDNRARSVSNNQGNRVADLSLGTMLALFGLVQTVSATIAFGLGRAASVTALQEHHEFGMLTLPFGYIAVGTMVLFVFSSDLAGQLRGMALLDQLTGLHNRHGSVQLGNEAFDNAVRTRRPLSVIVADIDRFKQVNDSFGHAGGDKVLVHIAERFCQQRGGQNVVARLGGEEFLLILPNKPEPTAEEIAEALRADIQATPVAVGNRELSVTASFGVASMIPDDRNIESLIARADRAMYRAKYDGRNRVAVAQNKDETWSP